jgi:hypothetical protein
MADFSKPDNHKIYQEEVKKRMEPPFNMSRTQAEMLVFHLMWSPSTEEELIQTLAEEDGK